MNSERFSTIAHGLLTYSAPISTETVRELVGLLPLKANDTVLDIGCGRGALLLQLVERFGCHGVGVDLSKAAIETARQAAAGKGVAERISLLEMDARSFVAREPFSLAMCVGATYALGGLDETLRFLASSIAKGGLLLVGEGFWQRPPAPEYLAAIGGSATELTTHAENVSRARKLGLSCIWSRVSSPQDWEHYESLYRFAMSRYLRAHPEDPEADEFRRRSDNWYSAYLAWGRETMGFALYLFEG